MGSSCGCSRLLNELGGQADRRKTRSFNQADVRPFAENILMACFRNIEKGTTPEKIAENDYLMKCECCWVFVMTSLFIRRARRHACHHHGTERACAARPADSRQARGHHRRDQQEPVQPALQPVHL